MVDVNRIPDRPLHLVDNQGVIVDAGGSPTPMAEILTGSKPRRFLPIHEKLIKSSVWWKWNHPNKKGKELDTDLFNAVVEEENKDKKNGNPKKRMPASLLLAAAVMSLL